MFKNGFKSQSAYFKKFYKEKFENSVKFIYLVSYYLESEIKSLISKSISHRCLEELWMFHS